MKTNLIIPLQKMFCSAKSLDMTYQGLHIRHPELNP